MLSSPQPQNYPSVYWFWHHTPSSEEIRQQVNSIAAAGYKTFLIQPRLSYPREEYLGEKYLGAYREAVIAARQLGLTVGIYDDYNWISGHAGGRTVQGHETFREQHLFWASSQARNRVGTCTISNIHSIMIEGLGEAGMNWCYEDGKIRWGDWGIFRVLAYPGEGSFGDRFVTEDITRYSHLQQADETGCTMVVQLPDDFPNDLRFTAFVHARCLSSRLINYLSQAAADQFIEVGYEPYRRTMGDLFGDPIRYMFFDHPYCGFYQWDEHEGNIGNSLMFTDDLPAVFAEEHAYPITDALLSFVLPKRKETARLRSDFFDTYGRLGRSTFFGTLSRWCQKYGIGLAGHELLGHVGAWGLTDGFPDLDVRTNFGADYFDIDRYRTQTTVDACNYHPQVSAKFGDSVAKAHGRKGCIIEQYAVSKTPGVPGAAGQWGLTLGDLRTQAIRHQMLGASQFLFHAYYQTDGSPTDLQAFKNPRVDFPPGINFEPWFGSHPQFAEEIAQLSAFIENAASNNSIAVLYPLATFWAEGSHHAFSAHSGFWYRWLAEHGYGYDILDEAELTSASIERGALETRSGAYRCLILPGVTTLQKNESLTQIQAFLRSGGALIASGPLLTATQQAGSDPSIAAQFAHLLADSENTLHVENLPLDPQADEELMQILHKKAKILPTVEACGSQPHPVWTWTGTQGEDRRVAVFNDGDTTNRVTLNIPDGKYAPVFCNLETGLSVPWTWYDWTGTGTRVYLDLEPKELAGFHLVCQNKVGPTLISASKPVTAATIEDHGQLEVRFVLDPLETMETVFCAEDQPTVIGAGSNVKISHCCDQSWKVLVRAGTGPESEVIFKDWKFHLEGSQQGKSIDPTIGWEQQGFEAYSGTGVYECHFDLPENHLAWNWSLVFPRVETDIAISLNGQAVGERAWSPYRFDLDGIPLQTEGNRLVLKVRNTAANRYYHHTPFEGGKPAPSGLVGAPNLQPKKKIRIIA